MIEAEEVKNWIKEYEEALIKEAEENETNILDRL